MAAPGYRPLFEELRDHAELLAPATHSAGILLTGSAGVGKTHLVSCLVHSLTTSQQPPQRRVQWVSMQTVLLQASTLSTAPVEEMVRWIWDDGGGISSGIGASEANLLLVLEDLHCLDEFASAGSSSSGSRRVVAALTLLLDKLVASPGTCQVIGIARQAQNVPQSLVQPNRLECEFVMETPTQQQRKEMLQALLTALVAMEKEEQENKGLTTDEDKQQLIQQWAEWLSTATAGCVAVDLARLCENAHLRAQSIVTDDCNGDAPVTWDDLVWGARGLVPSQLQQLNVKMPLAIAPSSFDEQENGEQRRHQSWYRLYEKSFQPFAGYSTLKKRIYRTVVLPWRHYLHQDGDNNDASKSPAPPRGVVFHGPSGCGKTLVATCLGSALSLPMIAIRAADILDPWLGGAEATLRSVFARARSAAPCILFLDEVDALVTNRDDDDDEATAGGVMSRLLSTFLNELDGVASASSSSANVLVVACTHRIKLLDAALLRPGRLEEHLEIPFPSVSDVYAILRFYFSHRDRHVDNTMEQKDTFVSDSVDLQEMAVHISKRNNEITPATLEGLAKEAVLWSIRRQQLVSDGQLRDPCHVSMTDIQHALGTIHMESM